LELLASASRKLAFPRKASAGEAAEKDFEPPLPLTETTI